MRKLVVIGNGFDIAHGIPTRYSNFMEYLLRYEQKPQFFEGSKRYALLSSISPQDQARHRFYEALSKYIPEQDLWCSFEEALGDLDYEQIQEDNSCYLLDYADDNWRDSANHDFQYMIEQDLSFAADIPRYFLEWIRTINTNVPPICSSKIIGINDLFLNFNYTNTLENVYDIPTVNILYIHGNALQGDNLILGHHDTTLFQEKSIPAFNSAEEHDVYLESIDEDFRITEARDIIKAYFRKTYKDTASIIKEKQVFFCSLLHVDTVFVLGHSLSEIDMDYFIEIRKNVSPTCKWYISYYSQDDFFKAKNFVDFLQIQYYQLITFADIK